MFFGKLPLFRMFSPSILISPSCGIKKPTIVLNNMLFPEPFLPIIPTTSPLFADNEISFRIYSFLNFKLIESTWTKGRSEEHTSELQSRGHLVCRLLLEKKK